MESQAFFDNFEIVANAPGGITRLRELILDLAIRGALVGQDDLDRPLDIAWDFDLLKLDSQKIWGDEFLESTPKSWARLPLAMIGKWGSGGTPKRGNRTYYGGEIPWLVIGDLNDGLVLNAENFITKKGLAESSATLVPMGAVFVAMYGSIGKSGIAGIECATNQAIAHCVPDQNLVSTEFLFRLILGLRKRLFGQGRGLAQQNISQTVLKHLMVSLPPLTEQRRIVAKVDELMALCDELESAQIQRDSTRTSARRSAIDSFSTATTPDELNAAWKRISDNWLTIADTSESIASLRSMILSLAVRGKLVDQRMPEGVGLEFVSEFSGSFEPLRVPKTVPFEIPETWVWSYLGNVSINRDYERIPISKPERETRQGPYDYYGASGVIDSYDEFLFDKPLLLIGEDGANLVNRSTPIAFMARGKYWVNNHAHVIDSTSEHALEYLAIVINQMDLKPFLTGTAQPKLNQAKLNGLQIPVPPLDEQKRIVAKVEELMALCGELERSVDKRNELTKKISGSLVSETAA